MSKKFSGYSAPVTTGPADDYDARTRRFDPEKHARLQAEAQERDENGRFVAKEESVEEAPKKPKRKRASSKKSKSKKKK